MYVTDKFETETLEELVKKYTNDDNFVTYGVPNIDYIHWQSNQGQLIALSDYAIEEFRNRLIKEWENIIIDNSEYKEHQNKNRNPRYEYD